MNYFKGFALAFNMLTIIPFFKVHHFFQGINGISAMFYPLIGFFIGALLWLTHTLLAPYFPAPHLALLIFALWVTLTGALHLDGFSDTVDGLFVEKKKALEVMKDSHVGGMGMIFTALFLLLKLSTLLYADAYALLPVVLMLSRFNASLAIYFYNYISGGVGALLKEEFSRKYLLLCIFYTLLLTSCFSFTFALFVSLLTLIIIAHFFTQRLGGLSGDIYGFIIEVSEVVLLNYIIIVKHL